MVTRLRLLPASALALAQLMVAHHGAAMHNRDSTWEGSMLMRPPTRMCAQHRRQYPSCGPYGNLIWKLHVMRNLFEKQLKYDCHTFDRYTQWHVIWKTTVQVTQHFFETWLKYVLLHSIDVSRNLNTTVAMLKKNWKTVEIIDYWNNWISYIRKL
jgi:hypothetical protein